MKIGERMYFDGDKLVHHRKFDNDPYLREADRLRKAGVGQTGEKRLVGRVPMHLINDWLKEAGVSWDDRQGRQDVIKRKMLSGEFDKLRVWEGSY